VTTPCHYRTCTPAPAAVTFTQRRDSAPVPLLIVCACCQSERITPDQFAQGRRLCERCGTGGGGLPPPLPDIHQTIAETDDDSDDDADTPILREGGD
jgi:hypothetical protein